MLPKKYSSELYHYGVLGMKWGVRRYRNEDGSLTPVGIKRNLDRYRRAEEKYRHGSNHRLTGYAIETHPVTRGTKIGTKLSTKAYDAAEKKESRWKQEAREASKPIRDKIDISKADAKNLGRLADKVDAATSNADIKKYGDQWSKLANDIMMSNSDRLVKDLQVSNKQRQIIDDIIFTEIIEREREFQI